MRSRLNVAKQIAGPNFFWHVDAVGLVWFQPAPTSVPPDVVTIKRRIDYTKYRKWTRDITNLKNFVKALGGPKFHTPSGPLSCRSRRPVQQRGFAEEDMGCDRSTRRSSFPTVNDQATLDLIVNTSASPSIACRTSSRSCCRRTSRGSASAALVV
jgi:hypothetical protein